MCNEFKCDYSAIGGQEPQKLGREVWSRNLRTDSANLWPRPSAYTFTYHCTYAFTHVDVDVYATQYTYRSILIAAVMAATQVATLK